MRSLSIVEEAASLVETGLIASDNNSSGSSIQSGRKSPAEQAGVGEEREEEEEGEGEEAPVLAEGERSTSSSSSSSSRKEKKKQQQEEEEEEAMASNGRDGPAAVPGSVRSKFKLAAVAAASAVTDE